MRSEKAEPSPRFVLICNMQQIGDLVGKFPESGSVCVRQYREGGVIVGHQVKNRARSRLLSRVSYRLDTVMIMHHPSKTVTRDFAIQSGLLNPHLLNFPKGEQPARLERQSEVGEVLCGREQPGSGNSIA